MDFLSICLNWARKQNVLKSFEKATPYRSKSPTYILHRCFEFEYIANPQGGIISLYFKPTVMVIRQSTLSGCDEISMPPVQSSQIEAHLSTSLVVRKWFCIKENSKWIGSLQPPLSSLQIHSFPATHRLSQNEGNKFLWSCLIKISATLATYTILEAVNHSFPL